MTGYEPWLLPAAKQLYKNQDVIRSLWQKIENHLLGKKYCIAFIGAPGAGKTVLLDHLTGQGFRPDYKLPDTSLSPETATVPVKRKRLAITVVPGTGVPSRIDALEELFHGKKIVDGVILVIANGYLSLREEPVKQELVRRGLTSISEYRKSQSSEELRILREVCEEIRKSIRKIRKPSWMIVALTKVDLYYDELQECWEKYSPSGESKFVETIETLSQQVGSDNFIWATAPVSAWPEDFEWNKEIVKSQFDTKKRNHFLASFTEEMEKFCGE